MVGEGGYKPFITRLTLLRGLSNHGYQPLTNWDDPPSIAVSFRFRQVLGIFLSKVISLKTVSYLSYRLRGSGGVEELRSSKASKANHDFTTCYIITCEFLAVHFWWGGSAFGFF